MLVDVDYARLSIGIFDLGILCCIISGSVIILSSGFWGFNEVVQLFVLVHFFLIFRLRKLDNTFTRKISFGY